MSRFRSVFILTIFSFFLLSGGCTVGVKVLVDAPNVEYPVSQTSNFYSGERLVLIDEYEELDSFEFTFSRLGTSGIIDMSARVDVSDQLNKIIQEHDGDAITNLTVSVHNPPVANGLLWFVKTVALSATLISTTIAIIEPKQTPALIAVGSAAVYIFTPAKATIKVEGTVVKLLE